MVDCGIRRVAILYPYTVHGTQYTSESTEYVRVEVAVRCGGGPGDITSGVELAKMACEHALSQPHKSPSARGVSRASPGTR
jgi:hypothetical protein